jgi:hypothetical protein
MDLILRFYSHRITWKFKQIICALLARGECQAVLGCWARWPRWPAPMRMFVRALWCFMTHAGSQSVPQNAIHWYRVTYHSMSKCTVSFKGKPVHAALALCQARSICTWCYSMSTWKGGPHLLHWQSVFWFSISPCILIEFHSFGS